MKKFLTICALVAALAVGVTGCKKKDNVVSEKYSNQTPATQSADPVESPNPIPNSNLDGLLNNAATQTTVSTKSVNSNNSISQPQYRTVSYDELVDMVKKNGGKLEVDIFPTKKSICADKKYNPNSLEYIFLDMRGVIDSILVNARLSKFSGSKYDSRYNVEEEKLLYFGGNLCKIRRTRELIYSTKDNGSTYIKMPSSSLANGKLIDYPTTEMEGKLGDLFVYYDAFGGISQRAAHFPDGTVKSIRCTTRVRITLSLEDLYLKFMEQNMKCKLSFVKEDDPNYIK